MAILTAVYLINRTPSRVLHGMAPLQFLKPDCVLFQILPRVFGCTCFFKIVVPLIINWITNLSGVSS